MGEKYIKLKLEWKKYFNPILLNLFCVFIFFKNVHWFFVEEIRAVGCSDPVRDIPLKLLKKLTTKQLIVTWLARWL